MNISATPRPGKAGGNRQSRRELRRHGRGILETSCFPVRASLHGRPHGRIIADAIREWCGAGTRTCFVCGDPSPASETGAILSAVNPRSGRVAISGCCGLCWTTRDIADIEAAALTLLQRANPQGNFLDPLQPPDHRGTP